MKSIFANAFNLFNEHSGWIVWNLFLAFIPLVLSFWLFRWYSRKRSVVWWLSLVVFIAFLPNAAYLLTDIIHLIEAIRAGYSIWITTLIFIPLHLFAIFVGWEAYVISIINQSSYLSRQSAKRYVFASEILAHAVSAVGIYLGRFRNYPGILRKNRKLTRKNISQNLKQIEVLLPSGRKDRTDISKINSTFLTTKTA